MEWTHGNKKTLTAIAGFTYFAFGIGVNLFGQTLSDLECILNANTTQVSYGFSVQSIAYCISALTCGWIYNIFNRQWLHIAELTVFGLFIGIVPHLRTLPLYIACQAVFGLLMAGVDTALNVLILEMWDKNSNPYIQAMHFLWAIGSTVAPLISGPFLAFNELSTLPGNGTSNLTCTQESQIVVPYTFTAVIVFISVILLLIFEIHHPYKPPHRSLTRKAEIEAKNNCADAGGQLRTETNKNPRRLPKLYYAVFISLGAGILAFFLGVEVNTSNYLPTFLTKIRMHISKRKSAYMNVFFGIIYTSMRGLSALLATKISTHLMLYCNLCLVLIANITIFIFTGRSEVMLWASLALLGAGLSCIYPAVYAFIEERIDVTNFIGGLFMFLSSLMTTIGPIIIGNNLEKEPKILISFNICNITLVIILFVLLHMTDIYRRHRLSKLRTEQRHVDFPLLGPTDHLNGELMT